MVSVSRLEVDFSKSNVCFGRVVVVPGDGGFFFSAERSEVTNRVAFGLITWFAGPGESSR